MILQVYSLEKGIKYVKDKEGKEELVVLNLTVF